MATATVLVVEDIRTEQFAIEQLLKKFDYGIQIVSSGEHALAALALMSYAAILMDVTLPGMDGLECTRRIRRNEFGSGSRTPVIAVTAREDLTDRNNCLAAGMDDYMSKPFTSEQLRRVLLRHVYDPTQPNLKTLTPLPP
jgi:CheY-like chemotaxis protein